MRIYKLLLSVTIFSFLLLALETMGQGKMYVSQDSNKYKSFALHDLVIKCTDKYLLLNKEDRKEDTLKLSGLSNIAFADLLPSDKDTMSIYLNNNTRLNLSVKDIDSIYFIEKKYPSTKLNNSIWMTENLKTRIFQNGDSIPIALSNKDWMDRCNKLEPVCAHVWFSEDSVAVHPKNGLYYNYYAVADTRELAPEGWRISTVADYQNISNYSWQSLRSINGWPYGQATNSTGFDFQPTGAYYTFSNGNNWIIGYYGFGWLAHSDCYGDSARYVQADPNQPFLTNTNCHKSKVMSKFNGLTVRCVQGPTPPVVYDSVKFITEDSTYTYQIQELSYLHFYNKNPIPTIKDFNGNKYYTFTVSKTKSFVEDLKVSSTVSKTEWLAEDLKVSSYNDGSSIPFCENPDTSNLPKTAAYYKHILEPDYGYMYNFYVVESSKEVCPVGWQVATKNDYIDLFASIGRDSYDIAVGLKETGDYHWLLDVTHDKKNTNSSGFTAFATGIVDSTGGLWPGGFCGFWWIDFKSEAYYMSITTIGAYLCSQYTRWGSKSNFMAIRCVRNK